jgi:hypothetical protein
VDAVFADHELLLVDMAVRLGDFMFCLVNVVSVSYMANVVFSV